MQGLFVLQFVPWCTAGVLWWLQHHHCLGFGSLAQRVHASTNDWLAAAAVWCCRKGVHPQGLTLQAVSQQVAAKAALPNRQAVVMLRVSVVLCDAW
jgi:hypothetical protein